MYMSKDRGCTTFIPKWVDLTEAHMCRLGLDRPWVPVLAIQLTSMFSILSASARDLCTKQVFFSVR